MNVYRFHSVFLWYVFNLGYYSTVGISDFAIDEGITFMRILMLSPQPFMESRGVPFSVYYHVKALGMLDHEVDLIAYPMGKHVSLPGLSLYRVPDLPFIKDVKVGPSLAKVPLDILMFFMAFHKLSTKSYQSIFTHEEAGLMGIVLAAIFGCKHLYFMHSDLSQQIVSSDFIKNPLLIGCVRMVQKFMVRQSDAALAICPDIEVAAREMAPEKPIYMIENVAVDEELPPAKTYEIEKIRQELQLQGKQVLLYTGTLESYQGIDLLLHSVVHVYKALPNIKYILVGGRPEQIREYRNMAEQLGIANAVQFIGKRPTEEMPAYMAVADVLLSPRSKGTNTPLKLYTYLRSGKPILATNILSHTQILSSDVAKLVSPDAINLAQGTIELLSNPEKARSLGQSGQRFAEEHYSWPVFLKKTSSMYNDFMHSKQKVLNFSEVR